MTSATYVVPNIMCGHCVHTITTELTQLQGVVRVEASEKNKQVQVEFDPPATDDAIRALMAEINYPVGG
jgi:copper chaperone CopZ